MQSNGCDPQPPPGVVELREDIPLKAGSLNSEPNRCCGGGPKFILACFAALSAGITLALMTQIYYGDYEIVPHGSVSSAAAACSRAGTDALKDGGKAMDAAAATALCLAVMAPHRTGLDASGSLLYWEYRTQHNQSPLLAQWGGPGTANETDRPPRMVAALASLHSRLGVLPWPRILQPAINLAREGFPISDALSAAAAKNNLVNVVPGSLRKAPLIADYLEKLQVNTSLELSMYWGSDRLITSGVAEESAAGAWRVYAGGAGAAVATTALASALLPSPPVTGDESIFYRVVTALQQASMLGKWPPTGVSTGMAVVDRFDTYLALVTGLSKPFGSGPPSKSGWTIDDPKSQLDLAPAIIVDEHVCGIRYVIGAESSSALAQGAASLLTSDADIAGAVESSRVSVYSGGTIAIEAGRDPPVGIPAKQPAFLVNATLPYAAFNVVQQKADALQSHADSRSGGLASRFK